MTLKVYDLETTGFKLILGDLGLTIMENLGNQPIHINTLSYFCGIPEDCIRVRIPFLQEAGLILVNENDYITLTNQGKEKLSELI